MKMKKLCQGAVIFTVLHAQSSAFAEPRNEDGKNQKDASAAIEENSESESGFLDLLLPDAVTEILNRNELEHSGNHPIC